MELSSRTYQAYVEILKRELVPAMGCTEPIAIAYCAAVARSLLGELPRSIHIEASGNIIKNVKSVVVPNTDGRRGIETAAAVGALAGDENARLEVIAHISGEDRKKLGDYMENTRITVSAAQSDYVLDITITAFGEGTWAKVRAVHEHTNLVLMEKDGKILMEKPISEEIESDIPDYSLLNVKDIDDFACTCRLEDVKDILDRQIEYNTAISEEGLKNDYGANIGKTLLKAYGDRDVKIRAKACAAAGSDARMNGCELPVVINSGSGNQGITASVPVVVYAQALGASQEKLYRALVLSNLLAIHQKSTIGRLSAYCGAINAGAAAGCGIAYLEGGGLDAVSHTLVNALAISSGVICDGAKASCAGKIALAVDSGILGWEMYQQGQQFLAGDGIVKKGVENMIASVGRLGREGMRETDKEILHIMVDKWVSEE